MGAEARGGVQPFVPESCQDGQGLQQRRALPPGAGLGDGVPPELVRHRGLEACLKAGEVGQGNDTGMVRPRGMPVRRGKEFHGGPRHEAFAPFPPGGINAPFPGGLPGAGSHEPVQHRRVCFVADDLPLPRGPALGHPLRRGRGPMFAKQLCHGLDGGAHTPHCRMPVPCIARCEGQHVSQLPAAVVPQEQQPRVHGARNRRRKGTCPGNQFQPFGEVMLTRRAGRGRALSHQHHGFGRIGRRRKHSRHVPAGTVQVRFHHMQHKPGSHRCVEGVAAPFKNGLGRRRRQPVRRCAHPETPLQGGPGGE